jgi:hypothetical protein
MYNAWGYRALQIMSTNIKYHTIQLSLGNVNVGRDKTIHNSPAYYIHYDSQKEVEYHAITKYFYVS